MGTKSNLYQSFFLIKKEAKNKIRNIHFFKGKQDRSNDGSKW